KAEYGGFPAGSRALVPSNGGAPRGGLEVKEQGLQLVKGAWARILVGKDKTRAALHDAKEKAGVAASTASYKIKNTMGSVTSRVADVLEGDPQGLAGPYGQPPQDDYYGEPGMVAGGQQQQDPRSWQGGAPQNGYREGGVPHPGQDPRAAQAGNGGGYPGYSSNQGAGASAGAGGGGGGYGGNGARGVAGGYPGPPFQGQAGQQQQQQQQQPRGEPQGGGRGFDGGSSYGPPVGRGSAPAGGAGGGMASYPGQAPQPQQQQRPQGQGQPGGGGDWQKDGDGSLFW
ncbi:unnamed protein product, partial [Ectocarpus fasciculatus]